MKKTKIIPFDAKVAKDIQDGKIEGKIKTRDFKDVDEIVFFVTPLEYSIYAVINGVCRSFTEEGYERDWDKSGSWRGDLVLEVPDNGPQFKPFDRVLVRVGKRDKWRAAFYSHYEIVVCKGMHITTSGSLLTDREIIPYEGNENLLGTTYKPKEE